MVLNAFDRGKVYYLGTRGLKECTEQPRAVCAVKVAARARIATHPGVWGARLVWDQEVRERAGPFFGNQPRPQGCTEGCGMAGMCHSIVIT